MKMLILVVSFAVISTTASAERGGFLSRVFGGGNTSTQTGYGYQNQTHSGQQTVNQSGRYANCYDYAARQNGGSVGRPVGTTVGSMDVNRLRPGQTLLLQGNYNWAGSYSPMGKHYVRVEAVDPRTGNVTISHSNFNGNKGQVVETKNANSFRGGSVTILE